MKIRLHKFLDLWLPVILWAAFIFKLSSGAVPVASHIFWQDFAVKKTGHFILFGFLAILIYRGLIGYGMKKKKAAFYSVFLAFFYGATDEFHQIYTQGREARVRDVFIDGLGAWAAAYFVYGLLPKFPKKIKIWGSRLGFI